ncbi:MAG: OmpA family protein, partial [Gammaproteobacteria bacterium]|nr:OmpA family protein [Gammaproteobacteria bacterium]
LNSIIVRIREKGSFPSGTDRLRKGFMPVVGKLKNALAGTDGQIVVAGHTDDIPIKTSRFRSNWDLSAARAVTVVHELTGNKGLDPNRFVVEGRGDAYPLVPNDSSANRALNRRVELTIVQNPLASQAQTDSVITIQTDDGLNLKDSGAMSRAREAVNQAAGPGAGGAKPDRPDSG